MLHCNVHAQEGRVIEFLISHDKKKKLLNKNTTNTKQNK